MPASLAPEATALNTALAGVLGASSSSWNTVSVGSRWDFYRNFDLKAQFDRMRLNAGAQGPFINVQPGFRPGSTVNLFSATVDFLF